MKNKSENKLAGSQEIWIEFWYSQTILKMQLEMIDKMDYYLNTIRFLSDGPLISM